MSLLSNTAKMVGIEALLNAPNTMATSTAKKRWRSAFTTLYCSRAFMSLFSGIKPNEESLAEIVKEKSLDSLKKHGGVEGVAGALKTSTMYGIKGDNLAGRSRVFGSNSYHKPPSRGLFHFVVEAFSDVTVLINSAGAAVSLAVGIKKHGLEEGWYDGGSMFLAAFFIIVLSSITNFMLNRQFHKLSDTEVTNDYITIEVVRSGRRQRIPIFELVVGDVVCLKTGDQVPADGLFIEGHSLRVDESSVRGEKIDPVQVSRKTRPFLSSGTKVVNGYAKMLVTSAGNGMNTERMSSISRDVDEQTPLQARLNKLKSFIGKVDWAVSLVVLVVLLIRYFTGITKDENGVREFNRNKTKWSDAIYAVASIICDVVNVVTAEGLSLVAQLALICPMMKMNADRAMVVQELSAFETMASVTTICTNQTGTLTSIEMKVTKFLVGLPTSERDPPPVAPNVLQLIQEGVALNTTGSVHKSESAPGFEFSGSLCPTEKAILSWAVLDLKMEMEQLTKSCSILQVESFNSERKRSGVLLWRKRDNTFNVHWKGAAEIVLEKCSRYYDASGIVNDLDDDSKKKFRDTIEGMAARPLRCIAFAHVEVAKEEFEGAQGNTNVKDNDLTLLGLVGIKDPCRPGVKKAVDDCLDAGVNVIMITGENVYTAQAIAAECGILQPIQDPVGTVVEAMKFCNYTPDQRLEIVDKIRVMARSSPDDKLELIRCLKQKGHVVAVAGNGTNDAPALKEADIGLSMGIQGTEVAKESSDIIILDDNFVSAVKVLTRGKSIYDNIQKFIQFQLTANIAALTINFVVAVSAGKMPLTGAKFLWMNLIMDIFGAFALAIEKPTMELMDKPPVGRTKPLITNIMWRSIFAQALYQIAVLLTLQFKGESMYGVTSRANETLIFNTFVLCQVFNEFNAREPKKPNIFGGILRSKVFLGIIAVTIVLQVLMVEIFNKFADAERLNWRQWAHSITIAAISWLIGCIAKLIPVPDKPLLDF